MSTRRSHIRLLLAVAALCFVTGLSYAQSATVLPSPSVVNSSHFDAFNKVMKIRAAIITPEMRKAAAKRAAQARTNSTGGNRAMAMPMAVPVQGGTPNYFGPEPNWAYSPQPTVNPTSGAISGGIRKFVDSLPGLNAAGASTPLGNYIPVAIPDTTTYPG